MDCYFRQVINDHSNVTTVESISALRDFSLRSVLKLVLTFNKAREESICFTNTFCYYSLYIDYWLLIIDYWLLIIYYLLFIIIIDYLLFVIHYLLLLFMYFKHQSFLVINIVTSII